MPTNGLARSLPARILWIAAPLAIAAGLATALFWPRTDVFYSDGERSWPSRPDLGLRSILWDAGDALQGLGDTVQDYDPCLSADGQELYFTRGKAGGNADLYVARRTLDGWGEPRPLAGINTPADEIGPALARDGRTLTFYSNRPGGQGGYDLYAARRTDAGWGKPENLGPRANSPFNEYDPAPTPDGSHLLFSSNRPVSGKDAADETAWRATLREEPYLHDYDIYALDLTDPGAAPRRLDAVNSAWNDGQPCVSPDGQWLYFASDRPGGQGGYDLWRARITAGPLAGILRPENLGPPVNTAANELDPAVSLEGFGLFFSSNRARADTYAVYYARSHEVFAVVQTRRLAVAHILSRLSWPMIGLLAALVGLGLTLLALARVRRRPGLLGGAMMLSLILHLIALGLFTVWEISYRISELARQPERFEVSVSIPGLAESELSSRLRAALTDLARLDTAQLAAAKAETTTAPVPPKRVEPEVALAAPEPIPREIRLVRLPDRTQDLAEPLRPPSEPAAAPDPLPPEPPAAIPPKAVRPAERFEPVQPRPVTVTRVEAAPVATESPAPAPPAVMLVESPAPPAPIQVPDVTPRQSPPLAEVQTPKAVEAAAVVDVAPLEVTRLPRPATARAPVPPAEATGVRALAPSRAEPPAGPVKAELKTLAEPPLVARFSRPAEETSLASAAPVGRSVATPVVGESVRAAARPPAAPVDPDVSAPPAPLPPKEIYRLRTEPGRQEAIEKLGGTPESEEAVRQALAWFARHQSGDGRWDLDEFMKNYAEGGRRADGGGTRPEQDVGVTALAALSFIGAGHTHLVARNAPKPSPYAANVRRALDFLIAGQGADGDLRHGGQMYDHCLATMALAESYSMTGDERLAEPVRRAVAFIVSAQNPGMGWRYEPRTDNDTSVVGWGLMALKSAEIAGFDVPPKTYRGAANWLDRVRQGKQGGLYVYQPGREVTPSMTAEGLFSELLIAPSPGSPRTLESVQHLVDHPPRWSKSDDESNLYYWYYATMSLHQLGGPRWDEWNRAVRDTLVKAQRRDGPFAGSWDPRTRWDKSAGRLYSTALATLTLEVYYRYLPFYDLTLGGREKAGPGKAPKSR